MSGKTGKGSARRGNVLRRPRTAEDRARDRAVNRAIARAGDRPGPIIVRLASREKTKSAPKVAATRRAIESKDASSTDARPGYNSIMAEALLAAGVKVEPQLRVPPKAGPDKGKVSKKPVGRRDQAKPPAEPPKKPPKKKPQKRKNAKLSPSSPTERDATERRKLQAAEKRDKRTLNRFWRKVGGETRKAARDRWERRREEIRAFQQAIQSASFEALLTQWKRHVALTAYIEHTGHNAERLTDYQILLRAIEGEWQRRSKLAYSSDEYFDWPTTKTGRGRGKIGELDWASEGALSYLGYHVGESSDLRQNDRRALLRRFFRMTLPPIESPEYVASWGKPESAARLKKMADSLASFTRSAKRRSGFDMSTAISEWEGDLKMLYDEFYVAKFGFGWPRV